MIPDTFESKNGKISNLFHRHLFIEIIQLLNVPSVGNDLTFLLGAK